MNNKISTAFNIDVVFANGKKGQLCPNPEHQDSTPGSFSWFMPAGKDIPVGYCFACGHSVSLDWFIAKRDKVSIKVAREQIKNVDFSSNIKSIKNAGKSNQSFLKKEKFSPIRKNNFQQSNNSEISLYDLDDINTLIIENASLSENGYNYLLSRGIDFNEIRIDGFFDSFNEKKFNQDIKKFKVSEKKLMCVPGLFKVGEQWKFSMPENAIIIPIFDKILYEDCKPGYKMKIDENVLIDTVGFFPTYIKGFQYRNMEEYADVRYKWITSSNKKYGTGATSYHGFIGKQSSNLLITEGFFKGYNASKRNIINNKYDIAFVQGILNTSTLLTWLEHRSSFEEDESIELFNTMNKYVNAINNYNEDIIDLYNSRLSTHYTDIYIAYDMDVWDNGIKEQSLMKLANKIKELGYNVHFVKWDISHGKGLDDVSDINSFYTIQ